MACALLRHDVQPRFIGDLVAAYCHTCGCLWFAEGPATTRQDVVLQRSGAWATHPPVTPVPGALQAALPGAAAR